VKYENANLDLFCRQFEIKTMMYFEKNMHLGVMIFNHNYKKRKEYKMRIYKEIDGIYDILIEY